MSVSVESPLHFSQQTSPPSFSSPSQSPDHVLHAQTSTPTSPMPPQPPAADTDMNAPTDTSPPVGRARDREDAEMRDGEGLAEGNTQETADATSHREAVSNAVAVEVAAVDEDAMDTTPDADAHLMLPQAAIDSQHPSALVPQTPELAGDARTEQADNEPASQEASSTTDATQTRNTPQLNPPPSSEPLLQPPPPPPPVERMRSDEDSSDEDDGVQPWHPIQEDMSSPDEDELKEITASTEYSALDHEHWESKAFLPLEEAEYTAVATGRIEWSIDAYNGTREKPNRDIVMKSDPVTIGGHQWQIKFYPKGNDSDYLSVYLDCLSVKGHDETEEEEKKEGLSKAEGKDHVKHGNIGEQKEQVTLNSSDDRQSRTIGLSAPVTNQHAALPLLGSKTVPKRRSVAAQVSVVLYNPTEPRVHFSRTALHRFCKGSPDWGWTRFHGPYYDIAHRLRGQRQALLRNDKLAFTGYVRIVEDETDCLWEHHSRENPWDSFAMTGLQGLMLGEDASAPGGNMISAVASWMLLKPFRDILYSTTTAAADADPFAHPKPLLSALQKVLYMLRTQVDPGKGAVALDDILDALEWYGIHDRLDKLDVIETWEVLCIKLEEELQNSPHATKLQALLGPQRDYSNGTSSYRLPVVGVGSMQEAINRATEFTLPGKNTLPQLLTFELERQEFDLKTRSYVKVLNKVSLDEEITVDNTSYTLFGFIVHKQTLQSYVYQPILRPEGPGTRWYSYSDSKDENQVRCLTKRQAIDAHEGKIGTGQVLGNDAVAYVVMYVRNDVARSMFATDAVSEPWDVPQWISTEVAKTGFSQVPSPAPLPLVEQPTSETEQTKQPPTELEPTKTVDFQVIDSQVFLQHEGPGYFDAYDSKWQRQYPSLFHTIKLSSTDGCEEIRQKLASILTGIKDPRQIKFWLLDTVQGFFDRPYLLSISKNESSGGNFERDLDGEDMSSGFPRSPCRRLWVHIVDFDKLPDLPKEQEKQDTEVDEIATDTQPTDNLAENTSQPSTQPLSRLTDISMSESDGPAISYSESPAPNLTDSVPTSTVQTDDTAMIVESETSSTANTLTPDAPNTSTAIAVDTEMGGTQEGLPPPPPPPPPPPGMLPAEVIQMPVPAHSLNPKQSTEEAYFFLKFWDPDTQRLEARGSHVSLKSARVDETVVTLLGLPIEDKKKIEIWEEEELPIVHTIKHRRTFAQIDLQNATIIIVAYPKSAEQRSALAERAALADVQAYLTHRAFARNFPHKLNGHFTYNYFSSQYYKGEIKNGHRHGHGSRIYHSGATYEGTFRLGQRHGHGLYTFQNGDTYDGDWVDNQQHGTGTFVEAATGNTYVGGWRNDKKFGEGVTHWKNAQEAERMCRICWDEPAEAAFYDCGHVVACLTCAREVQTCPVCRKRVLSAMKLYYVA